MSSENVFEEDVEQLGEADELYQKLVIKCDPGQEPLRIDKFLMNRIESATRNKVQASIHSELVTVNGKPIKPNFKVKAGDEIIVFSEQEPTSHEILPEKIDLDIIYEDEHLMVINKQPGIVVHPGSGNYSGTLLNGIAWHMKNNNPDISEETLPRFGMVHRIDKNTSGLLLIAKNQPALSHLAKQFFDHTIERKYVAVVWGEPMEASGTIEAHVGRNPRQRKLFSAFPDGEIGKHAITHYTVLETMYYVSVVECVLETGRTHQIRVHMKHIGHTLFADETYGGDRILKGTVYTKYKQFVDNCLKICGRQALHAQTLGFIHPATGQKMQFEQPLPTDMQMLIEKWRKYFNIKGKLEDADS